jgi:pantoate--beta-alanine ligase
MISKGHRLQTIRSIRKMQSLATKLAAEGKRIGLVPTMGYLHDGHVSLIRRALTLSDVVITTIFVNPTQFAPTDDLDRYPRDEKGDIRKIKSAGGEIVFVPRAEDLYPEGFQTYVEVEGLTRVLEGASRPEHFRGVTTIVSKLFNITRPSVAVFGMKDFQQAAVLKRMTADLNYPIKFVIGRTTREKSGLAMSTRNKYFTEEQRAEACCLYYALRSARAMVNSGITAPGQISREMRAVIRASCRSARVDYFAFNDIDDLTTVKKIRRGTVCSLAVQVHGIRLIDNMKLA